MGKVTIVTRSFQAGTGGSGKKFDTDFFAERVAKPIKTLLRFPEVIKKIIVITNGERGNPLAENFISAAKTPTIRAIRETFVEEVAEGLIIPYLCCNWGKNPGSGTALNEGAEIAGDVKWVLNWSPEIEMDGYLITRALLLAEQRNLSLVGFVREGWWEKPQWNVAQNTAAIWSLELLQNIGGFAPECNGAGETIYVPEFGEIPIAGMEDFHAMLRIMKTGHLRWGMVGKENPLKWDINFPPGSEREKNHLTKVARQYEVMKIWASRIFPELSFKTVMGRLFSCYHLD